MAEFYGHKRLLITQHRPIIDQSYTLFSKAKIHFQRGKIFLFYVQIIIFRAQKIWEGISAGLS